MQATINSITPATAAPGAAIVISGSNFEPDAVVRFSALGREPSVPATYVSSAAAQVVVPDEFDGLDLTAFVSLFNPGEDASNELSFAVQAAVAVEPVTPLCSLGDLKRTLGIALSDPADDARLTRYIEMASADLTDWTGRDFRASTFENERVTGGGSHVLCLQHTPILSVSALSIDGQAVDLSGVAVFPEYICLESGEAYNPRVSGGVRLFAEGAAVVVTYRAGYERIPRAMQDACIVQAIFIQNRLTKQGLASESVPAANGSASSSYTTDTIAPEARRKASAFSPLP